MRDEDEADAGFLQADSNKSACGSQVLFCGSTSAECESAGANHRFWFVDGRVFWLSRLLLRVGGQFSGYGGRLPGSWKRLVGSCTSCRAPILSSKGRLTAQFLPTKTCLSNINLAWFTAPVATITSTHTWVMTAYDSGCLRSYLCTMISCTILQTRLNGYPLTTRATRRPLGKMGSISAASR